MITHTSTSLLFIRLSIILLQYAPLIESSLLVLAWSNRHTLPHSNLFISILAVLLSTEIAFAVLIYRPHKSRLLRLAEHPPPLSRTDRKVLFAKCIANIPAWERYLQLWFLGADLSEIKRENVRDFLLWAFFDRDCTGLVSKEDEEEIQGYLRQVEGLLGRSIPPGRGAATPLRLTIDGIPIRYRSVIWYGIVGIVDLGTHAVLRSHGFVYHRPEPTVGKVHVFPPAAVSHTIHQLAGKPRVSPSSTLGYWYRPHRSKTHLPVVFLHGIGVGLFPYTDFLSALSHSGDEQIGILALELLPISARLTAPPLSRPDFLTELTAILAAHSPEWDRFVLVSHSYGSVLTTHILRSDELAPRVHAVVMVDPVSVLLHLPDVAYNFTRRRPTTANEWQLWYFASMDVGVAGVLGRYFFWRENIIWREELVNIGGKAGGKRKAAACLSGKDLIVDTRTVARYLATEGDFADVPDKDVFDVGRFQDFVGPAGVEILWFPEMDHAQVFENRNESSRVVELVRRYCQVRP
ncbi:hypothetical protein QBC47DRAFT_387488 [Echria macrotheca]|uniref:AB hydrolase-1 domain-containing protein n=1 Tax=Echria macrotheca TaxID=438768 RepID=A0AAJ0F319_9PEZI|nr:hypothetical protein QBC47DRAFT_387488 [Echria macrotheca]